MITQDYNPINVEYTLKVLESEAVKDNNVAKCMTEMIED